MSGILVGITSWGIGCAEARKPGVFASIPSYRQYIDDILNK